MIRWRAFLFGWTIFFSSCGYHWVENQDKSISVPYIQGDKDGSFTAELIRQCASSNGLMISRESKYQLNVSILQDNVEPIGWREDPQKIDGKIRKHLTQNEERRSIQVEVSILDRECCDTVWGPVRITSYVDYDYVDGDSLQDLQFYNASRQRKIVLPFSLGQLEPEESAHFASERPLYRKLSQKIVDAIMSQW